MQIAEGSAVETSSRLAPRRLIWIFFGWLFTQLFGCVSFLGGEDLDLSVGPVTIPGYGVSLGFAQQVTTQHDVRYDIELDLVHQELQDPGPTGDDDFDSVRFGAKASYPAHQPNRATARLGVTWLRTLGDSKFLDGTGDFGGGYVGLGYQWRLTESLSFNPDVSVLVVDAEGGGDFGQIVELTWRLIWHL